jgi:hypothetical protein
MNADVFSDNCVNFTHILFKYLVCGLAGSHM